MTCDREIKITSHEPSKLLKAAGPDGMIEFVEPLVMAKDETQRLHIQSLPDGTHKVDIVDDDGNVIRNVPIKTTATK